MRRFLLLVGAAVCWLASGLLLFSSGLPNLSTTADTFAVAGSFPGYRIPDITLELTSGETLTSNEMRGSVIILNFWATWCVPCAVEMPELQQIYERYGSSGLHIIAINQGETPETVQDWAERLQLDVPFGLDPTLAIGRSLGVSGLPTTLIIDKRGIMRQAFYGPVSQTVLTEAFAPYINDLGI